MLDTTYERTIQHLPESLKITKQLPPAPRNPSGMGVDGRGNRYRYANLHYIRAAIRQATGVTLTISKTIKYLVEEGLLTQKQARSLIFDNYDSLYYNTPNQNIRELEIIPVDKQKMVMKEYEEGSELSLEQSE